MGIYIKITKIKEEGDVHYYNIETKQFECPESLIVGLDAREKKIYYYLNDNIEDSVFTIDLQNIPNSVHNKYLSEDIIYRVFKKARQAIEKNEYSQYLDYVA